jgi:molybdopterin converting factor subunit 1
MSQNFTVLLFAVLREKAGANSLVVQLPENATVSQFLEACAMQHPVLTPWLPHVRVAVNCEYAKSTQTIQPGDEIALIPPVAGG